MSLCPKCKIWHDLTADSEKLSGSKQSSNVLVSSETSRNRAKNGAIIIASHGDKFCQRSEEEDAVVTDRSRRLVTTCVRGSMKRLVKVSTPQKQGTVASS